MVDDYLQQLVEEGDLDSHGRITLDPSKARQKLADSRFSHSSEALLAVVAAYLLAGAREIRITESRDGWQFHSDAQPPAAPELSNLMQDMFSNDQSPALRELALAFNSLYPKQYRSLDLIVGGELRGWFENGEWKTQPIPGLSGFSMQLTLQRHPSLGQLWKWLTRRWARLSDLQILQARTRWSPAPVRFQQGAHWPSSYELDPPALPLGTLATMHIECPIPGLGLPPYAGSEQIYCHHRLTRARTTLRCALLPGDPRHSQLLLVYRGLTLARHHLPGNVVRFEGVLNTDSLDLDASRQHIVQNQRLRQRAETARQWILEGTAAWLKQLDPASLTPEVLSFLTELLPRLSNSAGHKQILAALDPMPLIVLADGQTRISLANLKESLVRFPALHFANLRQMQMRFPQLTLGNELHERPLLDPESNQLKRLCSQLRVPMLDSYTWLAHPLQNPDTYALPDYERVLVGGTAWQATIHLPQDFQSGNRLVLLRKGIPFASQSKGLFESVPTSLHIFLDGEYDGALDVAEKTIIKELKSAIKIETESWLNRIRQEARQGLTHKLHLEHYVSLLCLWMDAEPGARRRPPPDWLDYPFTGQGFYLPTPAADPVNSLAELLNYAMLVGELPDGDPVRVLADWLKAAPPGMPYPDQFT